MHQDENYGRWVIQWCDPICPIEMPVDENVPEPWILSMNQTTVLLCHPILLYK